ncbi:MAG: glycosyltransferase, partial [Ignavibacteriota bacterium]
MWILISAAIYFVGLAGFLPGLLRGLNRRTSRKTPTGLKVTVLVCARNEENNIDACLSSLAKLDYPEHLLEILVIDDRSTDGTSEKLNTWRSRLSILKILSTATVDENLFQGKINALILG